MKNIIFLFLSLIFSASAYPWAVGTYTVKHGTVTANAADPLTACTNPALLSALAADYSTTLTNVVVLPYGTGFSCAANVSLYGGAQSYFWQLGTSHTYVSTPYVDPNAPPAVPSGLSVVSSGSDLVATWSAVSGASSYLVRVNGSSLSSVTSTSQTVTGLACGASYVFTVSASNAVASSANSPSVSASTSACPASASSVPATSTTTTSGSGLSAADLAALVTALNTVNSSVLAGNTLQANTAAAVSGVSSQVNSVVSAQGMSTPVSMTSSSVLILCAGVFSFFTGFGLTKGYR